MTARERATIAWDVLPQVYAVSEDVPAPVALETQRKAAGDSPVVDSRPGLGVLSGRAGEALGSYVAPAAPSRDSGAVTRAPTAAQELVRTGRPAGRHGGGEIEIPPWFEAAAKKMFESQGSVSDGISLAELTLVAAAPPAAVAASTRGAPSAAPAAPSAHGQGAQDAQQKIDVEQVANDVYHQILALMDAARARNGEPYL
jgi:hypothetical protein